MMFVRLVFEKMKKVIENTYLLWRGKFQKRRKRRKKGEKETKRKDLKGDLKWVYLVNSENKTITQGLNGDSILRSINLLLKL